MSTQPTPEWHNPDGLTDEQVGVKDGWRLCLKTETEHEGCEWFSPGRNRWASNYLYEGCVLDPGYTYRTRRPLPESSTEPKEGGETCAHKESETPNVSSSTPLPNSASLRINPGASNAAAGTSNPDQQAASVQLPWLEQQQRDREALAAETDQAPAQEPTAPAVAEQELLPCPFCGTPPISRWVGVSVPGMEDCGYHAVECPKCVGSGGVPFCGVHANLREDAEKQWNRRPAAPVAVGRRECKCTLRERESGHRVDCEQKGAEA